MQFKGPIEWWNLSLSEIFDLLKNELLTQDMAINALTIKETELYLKDESYENLFDCLNLMLK